MTNTHSPEAPATDWITYFGTFTHDARPTGSVGIYIARLDGEGDGFSGIGEVEGLMNPSFLELHPNGRFAYAVSERHDAAEVVAMAIDPNTGLLTVLGRQPVPGEGACHVSVDPRGTAAYVANYVSGNAARLPILPDGTLGPALAAPAPQGSGPDADRQSTAHAHSIEPCPKGEHFYVADLGVDRLMAYEIEPTSGHLIPVESLHVRTAPGAGPRHFTFHPNKAVAYLLNELNSTIDVMRFNEETGALTPIQTILTLPADFSGANLTAEVVVHPQGRWLYASNRGHNSLTVFEVAEDGQLSLQGWVPTRGDHPRNFNVTPDGRWLVVANMLSNLVVVFGVDGTTGNLEHRADYEIPRPSCVRFWSPRSV